MSCGRLIGAIIGPDVWQMRNLSENIVQVSPG